MEQHRSIIDELALAWDMAAPMHPQDVCGFDDDEPTTKAPDLQRLIVAACLIYNDMRDGAR